MSTFANFSCIWVYGGFSVGTGMSNLQPITNTQYIAANQMNTQYIAANQMKKYHVDHENHKEW